MHCSLIPISCRSLAHHLGIKLYPFIGCLVMQIRPLIVFAKVALLCGYDVAWNSSPSFSPDCLHFSLMSFSNGFRGYITGLSTMGRLVSLGLDFPRFSLFVSLIILLNLQKNIKLIYFFKKLDPIINVMLKIKSKLFV